MCVIDIFLAGGGSVISGGNVAGWEGSRRCAFNGADTHGRAGKFLFPCLRMRIIHFKSGLISAAWQRPHQREGQERRDNAVRLDHNWVGVGRNQVELRGNVDTLLFILPN